MNYKYCNPVQFTDNVLATQIVNAAATLAETAEILFNLKMAYRLHPNKETRKRIEEMTQYFHLVEADIRKLAKGQIIQN